MSDSIPFSLEKTLFIDIETAPLWRSLNDIGSPSDKKAENPSPSDKKEESTPITDKEEENILREYWEQRYGKECPENQSADEYFLDKAAIHALYGRVVCIGLGWLGIRNQQWTWREIVIHNIDEKSLLSEFINIWKSRFLSPSDSVEVAILCGHNLINFDYVFLGRRMILNGLSLPPPWHSSLYQPYWSYSKVRLVDTMRLWSLGDPKRNDFISLEVLACALNISFRKSLSHHDIRESFFKWQDTNDKTDFERVLEYCLEDVRTVAKIYLHLIGQQDLIRYIKPLPKNS